VLNFFKPLFETLKVWWAEFTLQTKLLAGATIVVSIVMSGLTFWAVNSIQENAQANDTRFGRDLGLLLAANVTQTIADNDREELARFTSQFYASTSSVRYIIYADHDGEIFFGIPYSEPTVKDSLSIKRRIQLPEDLIQSGLPFVRQHESPGGQVTDVFVPLHDGVRNLGVMAIGINPNPTVVASSNLTRDVTTAVFVSIWALVILGAVFNALTITRPIKELLVGVKNIATGNFKQRIDLPLGGELGELIESFNDMAGQLERYKEQNIEELTAEKAKLETLVVKMADGALLLDEGLNVVLANPTAQRIFGWDLHADYLGKHAIDLFPPSVQAELTRPLYKIARGHREGGEFRVVTTEPVRRTIRILVSTVLDPSGTNLKGIAITVQDITREVELNEAKSQFISNISHELRTPLFNIKSFIETLYEYGDELSAEERHDFLETANNETDRLTRLVNDVLDLSRLESCRIYHLEPIDISQPIEQTLRTYQLNARDKGIELESEIEADLPLAIAHYDLLLQVFANLVGNSLKFTETGGRVTIRAYRLEAESKPRGTTPEHVRIEVADTGIGIDVDDREAIFDRFFRVENRVHTLEGTGLGLSIVRNIIDKHHSSIHLVSEVGVGTTFWFDLDVAQNDDAIDGLANTAEPAASAPALSPVARPHG
jgi:two-component system, OmpR family, sensor histidine kinase NblS